jgi:hypothetical protein
MPGVNPRVELEGEGCRPACGRVTIRRRDGTYAGHYRHHHIHTINLSTTYPNTCQEPFRS